MEKIIKRLFLLFSILMMISLAACGAGQSDGKPAAPEAQAESEAEAEAYDFHIGIMTSSEARAREYWSGAEAVRAMYGTEVVKHVTHSENPEENQYWTVQTLQELAEDPKMKAIIVIDGVSGTSEAIRSVRETRPDILWLVGRPYEAMNEVGELADLVLDSNIVARGYLLIRNAHELGCDTFVHVSYPRHMAIEAIGRRAAIMQAACEEFGMRFVMEEAPDTSVKGYNDAQIFIMEHTPEWVAEYGQNTAFFCTNISHTWPLIEELLVCGGYFIEPDAASPAMGYPEALGLDLTGYGNDYEAILQAVEAAINEKGGAGRFGTWAYSFGYVSTAGLAQHAINVLKGESELTDREDIAKAFRAFSPNAQWDISDYINPDTGKAYENGVLVYGDTYIMGDPGYFMNSTSVKIPEQYYTIK